MQEKYDEDEFRAGMGAEAIKELLEEIDLEKLQKSLKAELEGSLRARRVSSII